MAEEIPQEVIEAVKKATEEGRMSCARAHYIASDLEVPIPMVGEALDLLGVKLVRCQLGCF
jgi:hypothetical protein